MDESFRPKRKIKGNLEPRRVLEIPLIQELRESFAEIAQEAVRKFMDGTTEYKLSCYDSDEEIEKKRRNFIEDMTKSAIRKFNKLKRGKRLPEEYQGMHDFHDYERVILRPAFERLFEDISYGVPCTNYPEAQDIKGDRRNFYDYIESYIPYKLCHAEKGKDADSTILTAHYFGLKDPESSEFCKENDSKYYRLVKPIRVEDRPDPLYASPEFLRSKTGQWYRRNVPDIERERNVNLYYIKNRSKTDSAYKRLLSPIPRPDKKLDEENDALRSHEYHISEMSLEELESLLGNSINMDGLTYAEITEILLDHGFTRVRTNSDDIVLSKPGIREKCWISFKKNSVSDEDRLGYMDRCERQGLNRKRIMRSQSYVISPARKLWEGQKIERSQFKKSEEAKGAWRVENPTFEEYSRDLALEEERELNEIAEEQMERMHEEKDEKELLWLMEQVEKELSNPELEKRDREALRQKLNELEWQLNELEELRLERDVDI